MTALPKTFAPSGPNRLQYRIGRITASLEGSLFFLNDQLGNSVIFRLRRDFSGVF